MGISLYDSDPPAALELALSVDDRLSFGAASVPAEELGPSSPAGRATAS